MSHFGIICPATSGHLNPVISVGQTLQKRGHRVTLLGVADVEAKALWAGFDFYKIGAAEYPLGGVAQQAAQQGKLSGLEALSFTIKWATQATDILLREAPSVIQKAGIDALIVDQMSLAGGSIADYLGIPYVTFCTTPPMNQEPDVPPYVTSWTYAPSWQTRWRNQIGYGLLNALANPIRKHIQTYRQLWNLPPYHHVNDAYSPWAHICHLPAEFDFPRSRLPHNFYFTGPYHQSAVRKPIPFPFDQLIGKPLVYASLGTLQNQKLGIFKTIAAACEPLDIQLVISLGGAASPDQVLPLPGHPIVVKYAPQIDLLQRAALVITHAGMNTTLEALSYGVPLVAIPITNDQPGVAARIQWTGTGQAIPLKQLTLERLRASIRTVMTVNTYRDNAQRLKTAIQQSGGVGQAADILEKVISQPNEKLNLLASSHT